MLALYFTIPKVAEPNMFVVKRNGTQESVQFDKITQRLDRLSTDLHHMVDVIEVAQKVCAGVFNGVRTNQLDELAAEIAADMITTHPDYGLLAARIVVSNMYKETPSTFVEAMHQLYDHKLISAETWDVVNKFKTRWEDHLQVHQDFAFTYFGIRTLAKSYLQKIDDKIVERPQYMHLRVAIGIHGADASFEEYIETYRMAALGEATHASPTLFNAGTNIPQMSSCFLLQIKEDSLEGIFDTIKDCARISKTAGGIGVDISNVRSNGSLINGTNGKSDGIVPMSKLFNDTARYINQGGRRNGAFALYLAPWHADIMDFLQLKKNQGAEELRARDLFYGLWISDLFMRRVKQEQSWSLMSPDTCPGLSECWGDEFEALYTKYEQEKKYVRQVPARDIWDAIMTSQTETGTPYMCYKDAVNRKSTQQHCGTIHSSNLCTEITLVTNPEEIAVCNLASIALNKCVVNGKFDHDKLFAVTQILTRNLNKVIDRNYYPVVEGRNSNMKHRPLGIGVQGLADTFFLLGLPFNSPEAKRLNRDIFETMYYAALSMSCELAEKYGKTYEAYPGSPMSQGMLQMDMWDKEGAAKQMESSSYSVYHTPRPWSPLRQRIAQHGLYNCMFIALMPTASTSNILGNNECIEPITSNLNVRRTSAGEFTCLNRYLVADLDRLELWNPAMKAQLVRYRGSIQAIPDIPANLKEIYKTVWEIPLRDQIDMSADRARYVDQSQSFNVHMLDISPARLTKMHFYGWNKGLKTGMYYLRGEAASNSIQFSEVKSQQEPVASKKRSREENEELNANVCSLKNRKSGPGMGSECTSCGA